VMNFPAQTLTAGDFQFKVGTSADPSTWGNGPQPTSVTIRRGAGAGGSDRITLTFADGAILNKWLQVTVRANANTGLSKPDVFYFGNLVGETGDSATAAAVTALDQTGVRKNVNALSAPVTSRYDFDRDGRVTLGDMLIARRNQYRPALRLITAPAAPAAGAAGAASVESFGQTPIGGMGTSGATGQVLDETTPVL
jgi:hypothetical protein